MKKYIDAAIIVRVSTDMQTKYSPDSQIKECLKFAQTNNIYVSKNHIYRDDGISGKFASKRTEFQRMISDAKKQPKPFEIILVYDFSRFARNKEESVMYKSMLKKKCGIKVVSITQPLGEGKESIILESMYEAMDEYYLANLSINVKRGLAEKASRGEFFGKAPYGYKYNKIEKRLEIEQAKADVVKMVFDDYINGSDLRTITLKLNDMNIKTNRNNEWEDRSVRLMLHNPAYIGKIRYADGGFGRNYYDENIIEYDSKHEHIISVETWNKAKKINDEKRETTSKSTKSSVKHEHWIRGLLKCGNCGKSLVKNTNNFQCCAYNKGQCTKSHSISVRIFENCLLEHIKTDFTNKLDINISFKPNEDNNELPILENNLKRLTERENRIKLAYQDGIDTIEEYKVNKTNLLNEIKQTNKQIALLKKEQKNKCTTEYIYKKCEEAYTILNDKDTNENIKFYITHQLFERIVYNKDKKELEITYK